MPSTPRRSQSRATWSSTALGIVVLAGLLAVIYFAARAGWREFRLLENQVAAAVVAASATVFVSVASVTLTRLYERRNDRLRELHAKRIPVYERFIQEWLGLVLQSSGQLDEDRAKEFFVTITPDILVWASDEVLLKWSRERRRWAGGAVEVGGPETDAMNVMFHFEELLLAMRRDLGHRNTGIGKGDVLGLWVNDVDDFVDQD